MPDRARSELSAMQAIADILSSLPDGESRARVLRWIGEHFATAPPAPVGPLPMIWSAESPSSSAPAPKLPASEEPQGDPENLDSLFDEGSVPSLTMRRLKRQPAPQPVASMLRSFVADFQQLAEDWEKSA